jgi:hypothetical protein
VGQLKHSTKGAAPCLYLLIVVARGNFAIPHGSLNKDCLREFIKSVDNAESELGSSSPYLQNIDAQVPEAQSWFLISQSAHGCPWIGSPKSAAKREMAEGHGTLSIGQCIISFLMPNHNSCMYTWLYVITRAKASSYLRSVKLPVCP